MHYANAPQPDPHKFSTYEEQALKTYSTIAALTVLAQSVFIPELGAGGAALAGLIGALPLFLRFVKQEQVVKGMSFLLAIVALSPALGFVVRLLLAQLDLPGI